MYFIRFFTKKYECIFFKLKFQTTGAYTILFEGVRGTSYNGDIALDDIRMLPGTCSELTSDLCLVKFSVDIKLYTHFISPSI